METSPALLIRLATLDDVPALTALASRYYVGNLEQAERADGFLSILLPAQWFTGSISEGGLHVAVIDGEVAGFIAVNHPPADADADVDADPITRAMLDLAETLEFRGTPISKQRFAFRGPVLVAEAARGRGVYSAFNAVTRATYRDRFDVGMLFVAADNPRSLHTTTTKLGAESLAVFEVNGRQYHFLAYPF